jgi:hypothetical protein
MDAKLVSIYLNDHLTAATAAAELVKRARGSNEGSELGAFLDELADDLEDDLAELKAAMSRFDVRLDRAKQLAGWTGEKVGRLKPNGRFTSYSPLSRVVELEALMLLVSGNGAMWRSLGSLDEHYSALAERSDRRRDELEEHRRQAVAEALEIETAARPR